MPCTLIALKRCLTIHDDAVHFGVNSPEPTTSKQSAPAVRPFSPIGHAEPA